MEQVVMFGRQVSVGMLPSGCEDEVGGHGGDPVLAGEMLAYV